ALHDNNHTSPLKKKAMAFAAMALKTEKPWAALIRSTHGCFGFVTLPSPSQRQADRRTVIKPVAKRIAVCVHLSVH
ncbi:MAG TPA: hypothetical protein PLR47_03665, partial [Smithellaceae bacterium]|nr:hypothetical protein [Smithellaceae bacterium]